MKRLTARACSDAFPPLLVPFMRMSCELDACLALDCRGWLTLKFRSFLRWYFAMFLFGQPHLFLGAHGRFHPLVHMFLFGFELSFFTLLSYIAGYCVILFLAISLACGLYYLAELTEEYPSITKKIIQMSIYQSAASLLLLFFFDDFPWMETIFTLVGCFLYHKLMQSFPLIDFSSPLFIGSTVSFLIQNMMWYYWFDAEEPYRE
jgi:hypothetical protein